MNSLPLELSHTPGACYALAYWAADLLYILMNRRRLTSAKLFGTACLFLGILEAFMIGTDGVYPVYFVPCMLLVFVLQVLFIGVSCDMDWWKVVYFTVRAFILGEFAASLGWQLYYFGRTRMRWPEDIVLLLFSQVVIVSGVILLMGLLEKRWRQYNDRLIVRPGQLLQALFIGLVAYVLSNLSYIGQNTPFSSRFPAEIFIIRTLSDLGGICMLYAFHGQLIEVGVRMESAYLKRMLHLQYENYRMSEETIDLVNQKYHDLKHQIALLRSGVTGGESTAMLDEMEQEIRAYEAQNKTGSKVLDTILTAKSLQCQRDGISLTVVADGALLAFMAPMDISALFGNALDNAMESVRKIDDVTRRLIHLSVSRQKGFVRVRVENCYVGELRLEHGTLATTKRNPSYHGYGLKSMQRIADKYGGSVTWGAQDGWFELRVLIPAQEAAAA